MQPYLRATVIPSVPSPCAITASGTRHRAALRRRRERRGVSGMVVTGILVGVLVLLCLVVAWSVVSNSVEPYRPTEHQFPPFTQYASQYENLAREIERDFKEGNSKLLDERMDWNAMFAEATQGFNDAPELRRGFVTNLFTPDRWGTDIVGQMGESGSYRFLRVREVDGEPRIVFRLVSASGEPDYHEYVPLVDAEGKVKFVDVYVHSFGEKLSRTLRRAVLPILTLTHRSILASLFGRPDEYIDNSDKIVEISKLADTGDPSQLATAVDIYNRLPPSVQKDKNLLMTRLQIAESQGGPNYRRTMNRIETDLAEDPATDLLFLRHRIIGRETTKIQPSLLRLDERVGGDPYIKVIQGNLQLEADNILVAKLLYREALAQDPALSYAYEALIIVSLREREFGETARLLREYELKTGVRLGDLKSAPQYSDFVKTREYREWLESRPRRTQTTSTP
ncbi:MAG: hypothetical protein KF708_11040 [Pirellulales bacterium]|nr:hypothetical protein [Pirellulales bacterium]